MLRSPIRKVIGPPSLLHAICPFADFILQICVALTAKVEAAEKALAEEKAAHQVVDQALQTSQEAGSTLTRDLQFARASTNALKEEFSAKSTTLDELVIRESEAQTKLQTLGEEKKTQEQLLESTQKTLGLFGTAYGAKWHTSPART
jgi:septal ring factor EnvC (AmiA/AmiB activator)